MSFCINRWGAVTRKNKKGTCMIWEVSHRAELRSRLIADRHYNRQKVGSVQFVPPGRCLVLYAGNAPNQALWITSWPYAEYVKHAWAGAWMCTAFRNENAGVASELISDAVSATLHHYGTPPSFGLVTFIDPLKVKPIRRKGTYVWGYTWMLAGFTYCGVTKKGLIAFQLLPQHMPIAKAAKERFA